MTKVIIILLGMSLFPIYVIGQIRGVVYDEEDRGPLVNVTIRSASTGLAVSSNTEGQFYLKDVSYPDSLIVNHIGYNRVTLFAETAEVVIYLEKSENVIDEIVLQTGYESLPKERATGSFASLNKDLLGRSTSNNLLDRLDGVSNGLFIERRNVAEGDDHGTGTFPIVRGIATLEGSYSPLIVLDGYPYDGDIRNIDPSIVENVTILKDAAASSIWGAQAGNGVIVITTIGSRGGSTKQVNFNMSLLTSAKPDFSYSRIFMPSHDFIEMEYWLFNKDFYSPSNTKAFSPVIEDLWLKDFSLEALQNKYGSYDIRKDVSDHLYRRRTEQNYSINFQQRSKDITYYLSAAYLNGKQQNVGDDNDKLNYRSRIIYQPVQNLTIDFSLQNTHSSQQRNGITFGKLRPAGIYPYARLIDQNHNHLPIPKNYRMTYLSAVEKEGLKDWMYRPLDELTRNNVAHKLSEINLTTNVTYNLQDKVSLSTSFNYYNLSGQEKEINDIDSYYVRDLMNRFTQSDGSTPIPEGAVRKDFNSVRSSLSGRSQLKFQHVYNNRHLVTALAGAEIREVRTETSAVGLYGYDDDILTYATRVDYITRFPTVPTGSAQVPILSPRLQSLADRYISQYGNASYEFDNRYIVSASARIDGSNLFGVTTNRKKVPLWSTGFAWNIHNERFLSIDWVNYLKFRYTLGVAGNLDRTTAALPVGRFSLDDLTGLEMVTISSPGNPQLRWEKVQTQNFGLDFSLRNNRFNGSIEYFVKKGKDLLGNIPLDPTTGYYRGVNGYYYKVNYADVNTKGLDFELSIRNDFSGVVWNSSIIYNYAKDIVTNYEYEGTSITNYYSTYLGSTPRKGNAVYGLYSNKWYGLDPETGNPLVLNGEELNVDYTTFIRDLTVDDLIYHGSQIPRHTGSWRNSVGIGRISIDFNITWKGDYYFRRKSIHYNNLFNNWEMHADFGDRWRQPGDELNSPVPSMPDGLVSNRDVVYERSSVLVEKGDNVRLKDLKIAYSLTKLTKGKTLTCYFYANDIGILWRANKRNIDPDRPNVMILEPRTYMLGLSLNL